MSYQTFYSEDAPLETYYKPYLSRCNLVTLFVISVIAFVFNIMGLVVGIQNQYVPCYENKNIMSLSLWLILACSVAIISSVLISIMVCVMGCYPNKNDVHVISSNIPFIIWMFCAGLYGVAMTIIGIIELTYQYESCKYDVQFVCVMIISAVTINCIGFVVGFLNKVSIKCMLCLNQLSELIF